MASIAIAPRALERGTPETPMRTYSRRQLKRRHTACHKKDIDRTFRRIKSLPVTSSYFAVPDRKPSGQLDADTGRGHQRPSLSAPAKKTPNDLVWEALTSSAPALAEDSGWNIGNDNEADDHLTIKQSEEIHLNAGEAVIAGPDGQDVFDPIVEENVAPEDAIEYKAGEQDVQKRQTSDIEATTGESPENSGGKHSKKRWISRSIEKD